MRQELRDIETDAARADDRDASPHGACAGERIDVAHHHRMVLSGDARVARRDAGREHDILEALGAQQLGRRGDAEPQRHTGLAQALAEVAQRLVELLLARDALGEVELAADRA